DLGAAGEYFGPFRSRTVPPRGWGPSGGGLLLGNRIPLYYTATTSCTDRRASKQGAAGAYVGAFRSRTVPPLGWGPSGGGHHQGKWVTRRYAAGTSCTDRRGRIQGAAGAD